MALPMQLSSGSGRAPSDMRTPDADADATIDMSMDKMDKTTKAMLFIDGTWLYYSMLRGRDDRNGVRLCPVKRAYGDKWHNDYKVDWRHLPILIAEQVTQQLQERGHHKCFVDVTRTYAFTSTWANTTEDSIRSQMIRDWHRANYEVTHLETLGSTEKCVDISLAVEMLSLATVPGAYDVAVILTGDKDFIPAMAKTRLKGKNVALVSMRNSANSALYQPPAEKDFDVVWLEDHLDCIVKSRYPESFDKKLVQLIRQELQSSGGMLTSRDLGRTLQARQIDGHNALTTLKAKTPGVGGLKMFLEQHEDFALDYTHEALEVHEFMVSLATSNMAEGGYDRDGWRHEDDDVFSGGCGAEYAAMTVAQLKEQLRGRGLPLSGAKAVLVGRLEEADAVRDEAAAAASVPVAARRARVSAVSPAASLSPSSSPVGGERGGGSATADKLVLLVRRHLEREGGLVTSNELGLVLQGQSVDEENALRAVKRLWGSVRGFATCYKDVLYMDDDYKGKGDGQTSTKTFGLGLV